MTNRPSLIRTLSTVGCSLIKDSVADSAVRDSNASWRLKKRL